MSPDDPTTAALDYVDALARGEIEEAWERTAVRFQRRLARHWAWPRRFELTDSGWDVHQLIEDLVVDGSTHPLWTPFAWTHCCGALAAGLGGRAAWVGHGPPEPVGPDLEMVAFARASRPEEAALAVMLEREADRWAVFGLVLK